MNTGGAAKANEKTVTATPRPSGLRTKYNPSIARIVFGDLGNWAAMDPFSIGESVEWLFVPVTNRAYLEAVLGSPTAATITDLVSSPEVVLPGTAPIPGTVKTIRAAFCHVELSRDSRLGREVLQPVPGSSVLEERSHADAFELWKQAAFVRDDFRGFVGFVVTLEDATGNR